LELYGRRGVSVLDASTNIIPYEANWDLPEGGFDILELMIKENSRLE
jgi:hypothetical protein